METLKKIIFWIPPLLNGARITVLLTIASVSMGVFLSIFLALGKMSKKIVINKLCSAYIFFFRGTPLLMQLFFIYYTLPMISPIFLITVKNPELNRFIYAFIAFSLNIAAYSAEIVRAALESIDKEQFEASRVQGLTYAQTIRLIILPQSIKRLIPPLGNEFIMMLKDTSLISMIALTDILKVTRDIEGSTHSALVYIPAMILYLIITWVFTFIFRKLEKKYSV